MGGACIMYRGGEKCIRTLVRKPEGRRLLGRCRSRRENDIKVDIREIWFGDVYCFYLAYDKDHWWGLVNVVKNLWVPQEVGSFLIS
jgi:hypothetical protein